MMAIPEGTTARQVSVLARWTLAAVVVFGMLTWWWPGYRSWGALVAAELVVLVLWLVWRTVSADRTIPGHPVHLVLLGPAVVLAYHLAGSGLGREVQASYELAGALDMSMIFQFALLAGGVMLTQSLLPRAAGHLVLLSVCGAAMMGGAAAALIWGTAEPIRAALTLLGFSGVGLWLTPLWAAPPLDNAGHLPHPLRRRDLRMGCIGVALIAAVLFAKHSLNATLLAAGVAGAVVLLGGLIFPRRRVVLLSVGGGLAAAAAAGGAVSASGIAAANVAGCSLFGRGEGAFAAVSASDSGLVVLLHAVGWAGAVWFAAGLVASAVWLMWHARRGQAGDRGRAIVWTATAALTGCALLAPGGLFVPAITLAVAFTWGMLPAMLGRRCRRWPGAVFLVPAAGLMLLQGLARNDGLVRWSASAFGAGGGFLHGATGFTVAMTLAWLLGSRRVAMGLCGILLGALAGGASEGLQAVASRRTPELTDWLAHAVGSAAAVVPYLLAVLSRWCESPDARPVGHLLRPDNSSHGRT